MENQIVIFELGSEHFGVEIATVQSIIKVQPITRLPHTPEFVEGVTNLRGKVLPVIDLRKRFGIPAREADRNSRIIVVSFDQNEMGIIVDEVSEVVTVPTGAVEAPLPSLRPSIPRLSKASPSLEAILRSTKSDWSFCSTWLMYCPRRSRQIYWSFPLPNQSSRITEQLSDLRISLQR